MNTLYVIIIQSLIPNTQDTHTHIYKHRIYKTPFKHSPCISITMYRCTKITLFKKIKWGFCYRNEEMFYYFTLVYLIFIIKLENKY